MVHIAVLDTYIDSGKRERKNGKKVYHYKIKRKKVILDRKRKKGKQLNHGTICYQILSDNTRDLNYVLHCIEVIPSNGKKGNIKNLIIALEWCLENNIQIISLSIGTRDVLDGEQLKPIIDKLYKNGVIIIAAFNNSYTMTYPATFDNVIGVCVDANEGFLTNTYTYIENNNIGIDVIVQYNLKNTEEIMGIHIGQYNSYAVPLMTSKILRMKIVAPYISSRNVRYYLKNLAQENRKV